MAKKKKKTTGRQLSGIRVAAYLTELPSRDLLCKKLHEAVRIARARLESKKDED